MGFKIYQKKKKDKIFALYKYFYTSIFLFLTMGGAADQRSFLVNDDTEFTGILKLMCERYGKVALVILQQFADISLLCESLLSQITLKKLLQMILS